MTFNRTDGQPAPRRLAPNSFFGLDGGGNLAAMPLSNLQRPGLYNWDGALLPKWRRAKARVKTQTARAMIGCMGDSTTQGAQALPTPDGTIITRAYPYRLAAQLNNSVPAQSDSWFGDNGVVIQNNYNYNTQFNAALVLSGNASFSTNPTVAVAGNALGLFTTTSDYATWTPRTACDTVDIYYLTSTGTGYFAYSVDGGTATTVNTAAAKSLAKVTVALGSLGAHAIKVAAATTGYTYIAGMVAYNSASPAISVINLGGLGGNQRTWLTLRVLTATYRV